MLALVLALSVAQPVFSVRALGVLGGDDDSNLSAYVVGTPQSPDGLLVDAGGFTRGLAAWKLGGADRGTVSERATVLRAFFAAAPGVLITHAHFDHFIGLVLDSPVLMGAGRSTPLPLVALPETLDALREHALRPPLWVDLTTIPKTVPALTLVEANPGRAQTLGGFTIETVPLAHPIPSAAFFISRGEATYLHLGDTGPTDAVWKKAKPLLKKRALRGVAIEVSFSSDHEAAALGSGHLTPKLLLAELSKLTGVEAKPKALGVALRGCQVMAIHIKASDYDAVVRELNVFKAEGLPLIIPEQGAGYDF